ncbi:GNAT family N-acetyltransferase [Streptomyces apocyni]|uniref:GNAT family N-acetyltransferase n=1 Tax=Streptomyces apocyni TaxID=2654677 RepID=UPI0012E99552|nr:GNAT family N-acetyltransferase [Streptomyces apocyni]
MRIRRATAAELPVLQGIERAAGAPFRDLGMGEIADDEPPGLELLEEFRRAGRAWVAVDEPDASPAQPGASPGAPPGAPAIPCAYLIAEPVDAALHIEQVSVHPDHAGRGLGRALLAYAADRAYEEGLTALTLTTFAEVPWNAPYYARLGFTTLEEAELPPGLRKIRAQEAEHGLDRWPRVCMRRAVSGRRAGSAGCRDSGQDR